MLIYTKSCINDGRTAVIQEKSYLLAQDLVVADIKFLTMNQQEVKVNLH